MEIEVGEYVRTEAGKFYKILSAVKNTFLCIEIRENETKIEVLSDLEPVVKHSKNIIDLIEEGDYVNGYKVFKANLESEQYGKYVDIYCSSRNLKFEFLEHIYKEDIKSIVTKEQIKQIEYRIKE